MILGQDAIDKIIRDATAAAEAGVPENKFYDAWLEAANDFCIGRGFKNHDAAIVRTTLRDLFLEADVPGIFDQYGLGEKQVGFKHYSRPDTAELIKQYGSVKGYKKAMYEKKCREQM